MERVSRVRVYRNGKSVLRYRLVAEEMLGRPLLPEEVVHHKDGNFLNDDPSNLEVLPSQAEHARLHSTKNRKCELDGCDRKHYATGLCSYHYQVRWLRSRGIQPRDLTPRYCEIEGCERRHYAHGVCNAHYQAQRKAARRR